MCDRQRQRGAKRTSACDRSASKASVGIKLWNDKAPELKKTLKPLLRLPFMMQKLKR